MRGTSVTLLVLGPLLLAGGPAAALTPAPVLTATSGSAAFHVPSGVSDEEWEPAPSEPWELEAGERCDFPLKGEAIVDEVVRRVLETHPDGTPRRALYKGALVVRVTHGGTGATYDADVGGTALVDYASDGAQHWSVIGPVLVGFAEGGGNLARGLYVVDGVYTMDIGADGHRDVDLTHATYEDLCDRLD